MTDPNVSDKWVIDSALLEPGPVTNSKSCALPEKSWHCTAHRARQVIKEAFTTLDYILCMDESNLRDLNRKRNQVKRAKLKLNYWGAVVHRNSLLLKIPIMEVSPAWRPCPSGVPGAAGLPGEGPLAVSLPLLPSWWLTFCVPA